MIISGGAEVKKDDDEDAKGWRGSGKGASSGGRGGRLP